MQRGIGRSVRLFREFLVEQLGRDVVPGAVHLVRAGLVRVGVVVVVVVQAVEIGQHRIEAPDPAQGRVGHAREDGGAPGAWVRGRG